MKVRRLSARGLRIPFRVSFKHASAERRRTETLWVTAESETGVRGFGEGCPRSYVTGETVPSSLAFFSRHAEEWRRSIRDVPSLRDWIASHEEEIDRHPAAFCAVETALLDLMGRASGRTVEDLLDLPPLRGPFRYSAVLGDWSGPAFAAAWAFYRLRGFRSFKIKVSGDPARDRRKSAVISLLGPKDISLRLDANNLWSSPSEVERFMTGWKVPIQGLEEPLSPPGRTEDLARLASDRGWRIILDESLLRPSQVPLLEKGRESWIINIRVSKMGGVIRSLEVLERARALGIPVVVGAQVGETSLLTRAGLLVAGAAGGSLWGQEGAFGTMLLRSDVCRRPLMFGRGGVLGPDRIPSGPGGFGVEVEEELYDRFLEDQEAVNT